MAQFPAAPKEGNMREVSETKKDTTKHTEALQSLQAGGTGGKNSSGDGSENPHGVEFSNLLLENPHLNRPRRWADVLVSLSA